MVAAILLLIFYKAVIAPFIKQMLAAPRKEEEAHSKHNIFFGDDEPTDTQDRIAELRKKAQQALESSATNQSDRVKYDLLLNRLKALSDEKPKETSGTIEQLIGKRQI
ncbi:MAG: hypothetical protein LBN32_02055 [Helicobacteraceae bacterium]|nr:hypothetical protein [Helicobacteraceae bacterium]